MTSEVTSEATSKATSKASRVKIDVDELELREWLESLVHSYLLTSASY